MRFPGTRAIPKTPSSAFDPGFKRFADQYVSKKVAAYRNDPNLVGYFSDNEIPLLRTNLDGFLRLPDGDAGHKTAARWLRQHHATAATDILRAEFLEFEAQTAAYSTRTLS